MEGEQTQLEKPHDPIEDWAKEAIAGSGDARERIIVELMPAAKKLVSSYFKTAKGRRYMHLRDDLVAAAYAQLVLAVDGIISGKVVITNSTRLYLLKHMRRAIRKEAVESHTIRVPATTQRRMRKRGESMPKMVEWPDGYEPIVEYDLDAEIEDNSDRVLDHILSVCETDDDRVLVKMRAAGRPNREIASAILQSERFIHYRLNELQQLWRDKYPDD